MENLETSVRAQRAKNLKLLIMNNYKNIHDFCNKNDLDYNAIYRYVNGQLGIGNIARKKFERVFGLLPDGLDKDNVLMSSGMNEFLVYPCDGTYSDVADILSQQNISRAYLRLSEIKELNIDKQKQIAIKYWNDSMSPHIKSGWQMLINMEDQAIIDGDDYAILYNGRFLIRKVFFDLDVNNSLILKANNPEFNSFIVDKSKVTIIGKPVYILLGKL